MKVGEIKNALVLFTAQRTEPYDRIWDNLNQLWFELNDRDLESYKPMIRHMVRWIDMFFKRPLTPDHRITATGFQENIDDFLQRLTIDDQADINQVYKQNCQGFILLALYNTIVWFKGLDRLPASPRYYLIVPAGKLTLKGFKGAVKAFMVPSEPELRMIWRVGENEMISEFNQGGPCHHYTLRLFYSVLQFSRNCLEIRPEPTLNQLRRQTHKFLDSLPWEDDTRIYELAQAEETAVPLIALYDLIESWYCLPWPAVPGMFHRIFAHCKEYLAERLIG